MSEWIDFAVYATQSVVLLGLLPRQLLQFRAPAILDRNADWAAAHPDAMQRIERSRRFEKALRVCAIVSIGVLLAVRLGHVDGGLAARDAPSWEVLKDVHGALMGVAVLGILLYMLGWMGWLRRTVPLAARRSATLKPRLAGDHLSRPWRVATDIVAFGHLALWLVLPAAGIGGGAEYWGHFASIAAVTVLAAAVSYLVPMRRPGYADRVLGEAYRRLELRIAYLLRLGPLTTGAVHLGDAFGFDLARAGHLSLVLLVCAGALAFLTLKPSRPHGNTPPGHAALAGTPRPPL